MRVWWLGFAATALMACTEAADDAGPDARAPAAAELDAGAAQSDGATSPPPPRCDVVAPIACPEPSPRYADVEPIFQQRCISCHDGRGKQWALLDYAHVSAWFMEIRSAMLSCSMPPSDAGLPMPVEEREAILEWIRCDYPP